MYKLLSTLYLIGLFSLCSAQEWREELDSLIYNRQYLSAYELLELQEEKTGNELLLAKVILATDYYSSSHYHRSFGFVNLRPGEKLDDIRKNTDQYNTPFRLNVDSLLLRQIDIDSTDYRLHLQLGKYYNAVFLLFGDRWGRKSEWLLDQSQYYFSEAYKYGVYDYYSLYVMGYYNTLTENYHQARYWYNKSLQLKDDPLTNYNLAVSCLFDGMFAEGVRSAVRSYETFTDSLKKGDAARIAGILYSKQDERTLALQYFEKANNLSPGYKPNQLYLLKTYLELDQTEKALNLAEEVLIQNIYGPDIPQEYLDMFGQYDQLLLLKEVFDVALTHSAGDDEAMGNILFHYGKLEYELGNKSRAKRLLKSAKTHFLATFDEGHQVFQSIDQMLDQM